MKIKPLVISIIVLVLIIAGGLYLITTDDVKVAVDNMTSTSAASEATTPETTTQNPQITANTAPGSYVDYSSSILADTKGTKLVFFHAPWCPQCRELDATIKAGSIPSGVTIIKVDYDSNQALRKQYGVTLQTTVVKLDDNGNFVKKFVAYDSPNLNSVIKELL